MVGFLLIPATWKGEIRLSQEALEKLSGHTKIALFAAVQFIKLGDVVAQLEDAGHTVLTAHGKRTSGDFQILGCDCYADSFQPAVLNDADAVLYVGDGLFHPKALALASQEKPIILFDPRSASVANLTPGDMERQRKKYKANLLRYVDARKVGVLVSTKTGQQYLKLALQLKEKKDKQHYLFVDDTFDYVNMEHYSFIECWVNTACPRIGTDDVVHMPRPLINIKDALHLEEALKTC